LRTGDDFDLLATVRQAVIAEAGPDSIGADADLNLGDVID
jgi:hypothetical protein